LLQAELFFHDGDEDVGSDRGPDLDFDGVGRSSEEAFDPQVLFDPFEKQFDLPSLFVDSRDDRRGNLKIIGEKNKSLLDFFGVKANTTHWCRKIFKTIFSRQYDGLVATNAAGAIDNMRAPTAKL